MTWHTWPSKAAFDAWHATVVTGLGLPRIGHNAATGQPEPAKQQTTAYTAVVEVAVNDWRAPVGADIAAAYPDGLGAPSTAPPTEEPI